ncbi:MAG: methyl-accepting chemotaxis protein [Eubacterium sp.]|nr:methyl-accepting chemotaxis protein [Eubacterium sp.]
MKKFKSLNIAAKVSLVVGIILVIGLTVLGVIVVRSVESSTETDINNRFQEIASDRATVVDQYFNNYKRYFKSFSSLEIVRELLENPDDKELQATVQTELDNYAATNSAMEGFFICDADTVFLCHSQHEAVGAQIYGEGDDRSGLDNGIAASEDGVWFKGVTLASSTGILVAACYSAVYDDAGNILGFVGGGCYVDQLQDTIYGMALDGYENAQVYLISNGMGNYIFSPNDEEEGAEISENDAVVAEDAAANIKGIATFDRDGVATILAYQYIESLDMTVYVYDSQSEVYASVNALRTRIIIMAVLVLIFSVIVVIISAKLIAKEIRHITSVLTELGTLDLTKAEELHRYNGRRDEVGLIAKAAYKLTEAVREAVTTLKGRAIDLSYASGDMRENTDETSGSIQHINLAASDLANTATSQAENVTNISMQMSEVSDIMQRSMQNTEALSEASAQIRESVDNGIQTVGQLKEISSRSVDAFEAIFKGIDNISASADKISEASDMIKSIAAQTNLLSLNASIEAARAGEAGKGFAVVADEIRNLSDQSSQSAEQINAMLEDLTYNTEAAVKQSDKVREFVDKQMESVDETAGSFSGIAEQITGVNNAIDGITEANRALDQGVISISDSISNLSAISEENAATAQELNATTETVSNNVHTLDDQGRGVADAAKELEHIVDVFKIDENASAPADEEPVGASGDAPAADGDYAEGEEDYYV